MIETPRDTHPNRAAILVIHGIGEQNPFQTLDAFTRGLAGQLGVGAGQMEHRLVWREGGLVSAIRMHLRRPVGHSTVDTLDLYEFYWAGLVQGRIGLREVLAWLARTSLTPLRRWSQQPAVLFRERGAMRDRLLIFLRELFRAVLLIAAAAAIVLPFIHAVGQAQTVAQAARNLWATVTSVQNPVALVCWLALVFFALMIFYGWWRLVLQRLYFQSSIEGLATVWWRRASFVCFVVLVAAAWWVHLFFELNVPDLLRQLWAAIRPWPVLAPLLATVFAFVLRRPLVKFIGDIALYVTADKKSGFFRTRAEILQRSTEQLRALLTDPEQYQAVYVAGHSLGSVIAYDTINRLVRQVRAQAQASGKLTEQDFNKLRGLLTFGSPLDKVYYFFRTHVGDEEAIRSQILSSLHGFRKQPSGRDYGPSKLAPYEIPEPPGFRWLNVYSWADLVSGRLDFYRVDDQVPRAYWNPLTAHLAYWNDPEFYKRVVGWM